MMIMMMVAGGGASGDVDWFADARHRNPPPNSQLLSQVSPKHTKTLGRDDLFRF